MLQDLRFALRSLRREPVFAAVATLTLAFGVGATTAIFTAVNAVLLSQLPFANADRLFAVRTEMTDGRATDGAVSPAEVAALGGTADIVEQAGGTFDYEASLIDASGNPLRVSTQAVVGHFFEAMGTPIARGRSFIDDDYLADQPSAVIISHRAWTAWFNADPNVVGSQITVEGRSIQVVGIAEDGFNFPSGTDVWVCIPVPPTNPAHLVAGVLRVRPGITGEQLEAALATLSASLQLEYPVANDHRVLRSTPLQDAVVGPLGTTLIIVLIAAGLLLFVACVNVTSLLLSRGVVRTREVAVRVALGASRWRIVRQLLIESMTLAGVGTAAGVALAAGFLSILLAAGASELPRLNEVRMDATLLGFAVAVTAVTGLLVGFAPALRLMRTDVKTLVNESGRSGGAGPGTHRVLRGMVVAEIALAVLLTVGAALLVRTFQNLQNTDPGFDADGRIVFELTLPVFAYQDYDEIADWMAVLIDRVSALPGVRDAGTISSAPFGAELDFLTQFWFARDGVPPVEERPRARQRSVSPDLFAATGIQVRAGRPFDRSDRRDAPGVVIVDELFASRYLPEGEAIGRRVVTRQNPNPVAGPLNMQRPAEAEIVGIVESVQFAAPGVPAEPTLYYPLEQRTGRRQIFVVRTELDDPSGLIANVRQAVREADPMLAVEYYDMGQLLYLATARERVSMILLTLFGVGALLLAAIGIYGIMAYTVEQRRGEYAVRAALGAEPGSIMRLVLAEGRRLAIAGLVLGLGTSLLAGRYLESQLFGLSATDPVVLAGVVGLVLVLVGLSTLEPARRASKVTAASVLRS